LPSLQDVIGPWTEVKLDIIREYAAPYSKIVQANGFYHLYIDAYAAGGSHISRTTGEIVPGSPLIALATQPPFREYHFIDADAARVDQLRRYTAGRPDVEVHPGDGTRFSSPTFSRVAATRIAGEPYASSTPTT